MIDVKECTACFIRQAHQMARLASDDGSTQERIVAEVKDLVAQLTQGLTPPEVARNIHCMVEKIVGEKDLYQEIKMRSNEKGLLLYPQFKERVAAAKDRFLEALEVAISGNIIDYGAKSILDVDQEIKKLFEGKKARINKDVFQYEDFYQDVLRVSQILYLADNAGEIVLDKILIEELNRLGKQVILAVRGLPIINDATLKDALACGLQEQARVVSNGSGIPGTVLADCSLEFQEIFSKAPLIISKGQGNFETLYEQPDARIYFLLKVKCPMVARLTGARVGDMVLKKNGFKQTAEVL